MEEGCAKVAFFNQYRFISQTIQDTAITVHEDE